MTAMLAPVLTLRSSGLRTLTQQALAILARYGSAANLYLPGVGAINGITAGNWLDTVGGTPATVDGAVGTVVNARGGVNLVQDTPANRPILRRGLVNQLTQSDFQNGVTDAPTRGGLVTASTLAGYGGAIAFGHDGSAVSYGYKLFAATLNAAYTLAFVVKMDDGNAPVFGNVNIQDASNPFAVVMYDNAYSPIGAGGYTVTALADNTYLVTCSAVATAAIATNFGVVKYPANNNRTFKVTRYGLYPGTVTAQQIIDAGGIPLTTTAPASSTNGPFAWQFDGSNDSFASTLVTGGSGWICSGVRLSADVLATVANAGEGNATTKGFWLANIPSSGLMLATSNGSVRTQTFAPRPTLNTPVVVEAGWDSSSQFVSSHGFGTASSVRSGDCSSGDETLRIGDYRLGGFPFYGTIGATIIMHTVLPTASERATLRQFIASLSGVAL